MEKCVCCPRLVAFIHENRIKYPSFYNAPVPSFGDKHGKILIVGLAPGLKGANRTGRPFTADYAGDLLYSSLLEFGLATGEYKAVKDDGLILRDVRITNAVRCVPPENKVTTSEIKNCNVFLQEEIREMSRLRVIMALGAVAHKAVLMSFGVTQNKFKFAHNSVHKITDDISLVDSYHCSRYNTSTGVLTPEMFKEAMKTTVLLAGVSLYEK